ncbi:MAG TPA: class I SAM-dependent methyltransferase [Thermomicrobiales bacterium]|nr:class I SAM-dependent methyltransferase [Thermomicrobiales bacterium]
MKRAEYERMYAAEGRLWWYRGLRENVLALLGLPAGRGDAGPRILDAGCGTGGMAARLRPFGRVVAVDLAPYAVAICHERRGLDAAAVASLAALPFPAEAFDVVVALDVLSDAGAGDDARALAELARVLRPGGRLCLNLPAYRWLAGEHDVAVETRRRYRRGEVRALLGRAGFVPERLTYWNCLLLPAVAAARLLSRRRRRDAATARSDVAVPPAPLNRALLALVRAEGWLLRRVDLPAGSSILAVARKRESGGRAVGRRVDG